MHQKGTIATWLLVTIILVFLLLLVGVGFFGWHYFKNNKTSVSVSPSPTSSIISEKSPTVTPKSSASSAENDKSLLASLCKKENNFPGITCEVTKIDGNYAYGSASGTGGGAIWYAKKVNGEWQMVIKGTQDSPSCSETSDFPKTIVPTCI
ncbi:MAG: hypothetical protein M1429_04540 [Patescibacteria group bacterium]|nr:hypothetical protein [Patescibacteria group bacterium]